jgi:hypothetical protein
MLNRETTITLGNRRYVFNGLLGLYVEMCGRGFTIGAVIGGICGTIIVASSPFIFCREVIVYCSKKLLK